MYIRRRGHDESGHGKGEEDTGQRSWSIAACGDENARKQQRGHHGCGSQYDVDSLCHSSNSRIATRRNPAGRIQQSISLHHKERPEAAKFLFVKRETKCVKFA
jgi:hypothetical protein